MLNKNTNYGKQDDKIAASRRARAGWRGNHRAALYRLLRARLGLSEAAEVQSRPSAIRLTEITIEPLPPSDRKLAIELLSAIRVGEAGPDLGQEAA